MCDRDKLFKPIYYGLGRWVWKSIEELIETKDKNHVTVSSMPDSFVVWTETVYIETGLKRATLLRQHLLAIPEYQEWLKNRDKEE